MTSEGYGFDESVFPDLVAKGPKVLLHDHLDGGLRPSTVIDLADISGYEELPSNNVEKLSEWFHEGANRRDLNLYLETFAHTVGVMQDEYSCHRVAKECAEDLAEDGCVYAEIRFAPSLFTMQKLSVHEVIEAVLSGFSEGSSGTNLTLRTIITAMRTSNDSKTIAEAAVDFRDKGVVGFDIAGREVGYPPTDHL